MVLQLEGRVAFVCGASSGLGRASADAFAADGCKIAVVARDSARVDSAVAEIRAAGGTAIGVPADVTAVGDLERAVGQTRERLGPIDIAIFNGPSPMKGDFLQVSEADFASTYHMVVTSFATLVRLVVPDMMERRWGRILTIGSRSVKQPLRSHEVPYVLANTHRIAAMALSKTLANELGPSGITVNTIATGRFDTHPERVVAEVATWSGKGIDDYIADRVKQIPLRRLGQARELGDVAAFLCSERASYITGETICCDGGRNESML